MKVLVVAGARPNFMKIAPLLAELRDRAVNAVLVHTGQHYDARMSGTFFSELGIPDPDYHLGVGSASHAVQTARIMEAFEPVLLQERPDWVVVVGDVNSTLACSLVTSKLKQETGARIAHVEAGLRSYDWRMPEEVNRVLTDRLSDLLLTPSRDANANLVSEGIPENRIRFVGNIMIDTLYRQLPAAQDRDMPGRLGLRPQAYALSTLHRPSNVDEPDALAAALAGLTEIAREMPVVLPLHPRTRASIEAFGLEQPLSQLRAIEPLSYIEMLSLTQNAAVVLTDSGGLQEETTALGVPCVTLREQTERPITITEGTNRMAPWPLSSDGIVESFRAARSSSAGKNVRRPEGWDGKAAGRIVEILQTAQG